MPWQMTMNPGASGIYLDISWVFLGILPLFLWYLIEKNDKIFKPLFGATVVYFFILAFFFNGVIWYGFAGIALLLLLTGRIMEKYEATDWKEEKVLSYFVKIAIGVTAFTVVFVKIASLGSMTDFAYWGGLIDEEKYIENINPGATETAEIIANDEEAMGTHILKTGGSTAYFLAAYDVDFIKEESFESFECLAEQYTDEEIIEIYRELNISYFAFDYTIAFDDSFDPRLGERYEKVLEFAQENLETLIQKEDYALFKF